MGSGAAGFEATGRSAVYAREGLVATAHPLATAAAVEVLALGGNAADAAVAAMGVLYAALPMLCGVGGDAFALFYDTRRRRVLAFCGSGAAPAAATPEAYIVRGHDCVPSRGMLAVTVPGAVDATWELLARCGSGRFGLPALWRRAVAAAEAHPLPPKAAALFASAPPALRPGGGIPAAGDVVRQPALAATLASIAAHGPQWFYRGPFAAAAARDALARGGLLRQEDLAAHRTWVGEPLTLPFPVHGVQLLVPPLPSHGLILLEELGMLAGDADLDPLEGRGVHLMVEAKKRAFADRLAFAGDPTAVAVPLRGLLAPDFLRRRRASIDPDVAAPRAVPPGDPWTHQRGPDTGGDTTSLVVVDREGNAASVIISLFSVWGSGEVVEGTGVVLNNRGQSFSLRPGHPNRLAPRKRPMHTLHCYLAVDACGDLVLLGGTPGGDSQPQWNLQVLMHLLRGGADPQEAVERPRWSSEPGTTPEPEADAAYALVMEEGFPAETVAALRQRGHVLRPVGRWQGGGAAQVIRRVGAPRGAGATVFAAGSDPRADGVALGL
jgi:gamma-glutamyltranspeptidase/glutathione hydrolase